MTQSTRLGQHEPGEPRISYEEFLRTHDGVRAEWVDGAVEPVSPVSREHQEVTSFLFRLIAEFVEAHELGLVFRETFQMKTGPALPGREPDILFVASEHADRVQTNHLAGPADLVVEVVSPESFARGRGAKFQEYERGGVREYWIIDPERQSAEFYVRQDDGLFHSTQPGSDGAYSSGVLKAFWLRESWLWQRPPLREVLGQLNLR